jgi:hypothetical protein
MTLVITVAAALKLPSTYQAESSVLLLASKALSRSFGGNPYLAFNATLNQTGDVVRYETMDLRTVSFLASHGYTASYLVADAIDTNGPVLTTTVTGHDPAAVEHTLYGVTREISDKLRAVQGGIGTNNMIRSTVISFAPSASVLRTKKARPVVAVLALGIILSLTITQVVDTILTRRRTLGKKPAWDEEDYSPSRLASGVSARRPVSEERPQGRAVVRSREGSRASSNGATRRRESAKRR